MVIGHQFRPDRKSGLWTPNRKPPLQSRINWQHPIARDLLVNLTMNEKGGPQIFDIAKQNATGILENNVTWGDQGLDFDGTADTNSVVAIDETLMPWPQGDWTCRVVLTLGEDIPQASVGVFFGRNLSGGNDGDLLFWFNTSGQIRFLVDNGISSPQPLTVVNSWSEGQTIDIVARCVQEASGFSLYIDGELGSNLVTPVIPAALHTTPTDYGIGADKGGTPGTGKFKGLMHLFQLWGRGLDPSEIAYLHRETYVFIEPLRPNRGALWEGVAIAANVILFRRRIEGY